MDRSFKKKKKRKIDTKKKRKKKKAKFDYKQFRIDLVELISGENNIMNPRLVFGERPEFFSTSGMFFVSIGSTVKKWLREEMEQSELKKCLRFIKIGPMRSLYFEYFGKSFNPSRVNMEKELLYKFFRKTTPMEKREKEGKNIEKSGSMKTMFVTLCGFDIPRHLLEHILSFCVFDSRLLFGLGSTCKDAYMMVLLNWNQLRVNDKNIHGISKLALKSVRYLSVDKLSVAELKYLWESVSPSRLKSLQFTKAVIGASVCQRNGVKTTMKSIEKWGKSAKAKFLKIEEIDFNNSQKSEKDSLNRNKRKKPFEWAFSLHELLPNIRCVKNPTSLYFLKDLKKLERLELKIWSGADVGVYSLSNLKENVDSHSLLALSIDLITQNRFNYLNDCVAMFPCLEELTLFNMFRADFENLKIPDSLTVLKLRTVKNIPKLRNVKVLVLDNFLPDNISTIFNYRIEIMTFCLGIRGYQENWGFVKDIVKKSSVRKVTILMYNGYDRRDSEVIFQKNIGLVIVNVVKENFVLPNEGFRKKRKSRPNLETIQRWKEFLGYIMKFKKRFNRFVVNDNIINEGGEIEEIVGMKLISKEKEIASPRVKNRYSRRDKENTWWIRYYFEK